MLDRLENDPDAWNKVATRSSQEYKSLPIESDPYQLEIDRRLVEALTAGHEVEAARAVNQFETSQQNDQTLPTIHKKHALLIDETESSHEKCYDHYQHPFYIEERKRAERRKVPRHRIKVLGVYPSGGSGTLQTTRQNSDKVTSSSSKLMLDNRNPVPSSTI